MNGGYGLYRHALYPCDWTALRVTSDWGAAAVDLARPPLRFWGGGEGEAPPPLLSNCGIRQVDLVQSPMALLGSLPDNDNWQAMTRRSLLRLAAWFLIAEDPQRRLDKSAVASLAHQASLVRHVLSDPNLQNVLIADEVGLGKTVEAGLIVRELLAQNPRLRVLYLAPARLVRNVAREFELLDLGFRIWVAGKDSDARLGDSRVIASIHRAVAPTRFQAFSETRWDVIVVDECHHLSDYSKDGTSPLRKYKLVEQLRRGMGPDGKLILLSGTPHQGHPSRFNNLIQLLRRANEPKDAVAGRVIYRTKEDVTDWDGRPLFPKRDVRQPVIVDLGADHRTWLTDIHSYFEPEHDSAQTEAHRRAATWRCAQALQWATSSVEAGIGYLVRQGLRAGWDLELPHMRDALSALRPYRGGREDEAADELLERMRREVGRQAVEPDLEDIEELDEEEDEQDARWRPDAERLSRLLEQGVRLLKANPDAKWDDLRMKVLAGAGSEKVVLFAQPIETVTALCRYLKRIGGKRPALIVGNQSDEERTREIESFWAEDGPQYLVSSRAGGEGLNLQIARRLVHVDVPWNPMEMEQRVGRVHRFKSRRTILVDTLVTRDSREAEVYEVARSKLKLISRSLVSPDRSDAVFARVMALVPPDELLQVMGRGPLSPLSPEDRSDIERLVSTGYERWFSFDDSYRSHQQRIRALEPGHATWEDVGRIAREHLGAVRADGYSVLRFTHQENEVVDASERADVFRIDGKDRAIGDYGGMPVSGSTGGSAELLGLNSEPLASLLRKFAFGERSSGAAHVRWPEHLALPSLAGERPMALLFFAKQTLRLAGLEPAETNLSLHAFAVGVASEAELDGPGRAQAVRALLEATVRRDPEDAPALLGRLESVGDRLFEQLATPSEGERENQLRHAVYPLLAAIVG